MSKSKRIQEVPHHDGWAVRREKGERVSFVTDRKSEAEKYARDLAKQENGELIIHGKDGKIQDADSFGSDPFPPRDFKN